MPPAALLRLATLLALSLTACATRPAQVAQEDPLVFVVVRHAERAEDDPRDPNLSAAGNARAAALAEALRDAPLVATYATEYRRTRQTAQPTADAHGLPVEAYFAGGPAEESAARWRQAHRSGTVLVVGHSNTVPDLVAALCGCTAAPMDETEYDRLSIIRIGPTGHPRLDVRRYGSAMP